MIKSTVVNRKCSLDSKYPYIGIFGDMPLQPVLGGGIKYLRGTDNFKYCPYCDNTIIVLDEEERDEL